MSNVTELYTLLASPMAALAASFITLVFLIRFGFHRNSKGQVSRRKLASVFTFSASAYALLVLVTGELIFGIPIDHLISNGFGSERIAWLFLAVLIDAIFRVWDEFRSDDRNETRLERSDS